MTKILSDLVYKAVKETESSYLWTAGKLHLPANLNYKSDEIRNELHKCPTAELMKIASGSTTIAASSLKMVIKKD